LGFNDFANIFSFHVNLAFNMKFTANMLRIEIRFQSSTYLCPRTVVRSHNIMTVPSNVIRLMPWKYRNRFQGFFSPNLLSLNVKRLLPKKLVTIASSVAIAEAKR